MQFIDSYWTEEHCFLIDCSRRLSMLSDVWSLFTLITLCELPKNKAWNSLGTFRKYELSLIEIIKFLESQKNKENLFECYVLHQRFSMDYYFKLQRLWNGDQNGTFPHTMHTWLLKTKSQIRVSQKFQAVSTELISTLIQKCWFIM